MSSDSCRCAQRTTTKLRCAIIPVLVASDGEHRELVPPRSAGDKVASRVNRVSARNSTGDWRITCWTGGSLVSGRLIRSFLFGTEPRDPAAMLAVIVILLAVAALACWAQREGRLGSMLPLLSVTSRGVLAHPVELEWPAVGNTCSRVSAGTFRSPSPQQSINVTNRREFRNEGTIPSV